MKSNPVRPIVVLGGCEGLRRHLLASLASRFLEACGNERAVKRSIARVPLRRIACYNARAVLRVIPTKVLGLIVDLNTRE